MAKGTGFDIPNAMRVFAEKSVEQARVAFDSFISAAQQAVNTAQAQALTAQSGAREVAELALRFSEENVASSFEFAQRLVMAKDASEVAGMHADYVKNQIAVLSDQAKELSKKATKLAGQNATEH